MIISLDIPEKLVQLIDAQVSVNRPKPAVWPFGKRVLHQHKLTQAETKRLDTYHREVALYEHSLEIWRRSPASRSTVVTEILMQAFSQ